MITKEKILEILDKYAKDNFGINNTYIDKLEFEDLAEELVKNCSIPYVVGQSEQFYCTCSRAKGLDHDEEGTPYCISCQKEVQF